MNPRQLRLIIGFLTVFVLLSLVPRLPDLGTAIASALSTVALTDGVGDLLLVCAGGLVLSVGLLAARQRWLGRPRRERLTTAAILARPFARRSARTAGSDSAESVLLRKLRKASDRGGRVPELARRFGLSQDAVRGALGRSPTAPSARPGSSFRNRKPASLAPARPTAMTPRRSPYQVIA